MNELDALAHEAWTADRARVKELWKQARKHPALARSVWTFEWVKKRGYEQDGRLDQNALECAALGLAVHGDPRIVPFLVARAFERWDFGRMLLPWLETDRVDRSPIAAAARLRIRDDEAGVHVWKLAARCLSSPSDAELVAHRAGQCFDAMWSNDVSQTVRMEAHAAELAESLRRLSVPRSFVTMLEGVVQAESHTVDRARGTAAILLADLGTGLDAIVRGLRTELDRGDAARVVPGQLLAIGTLGKGAHEEKRASLAVLIRKVIGEPTEAREITVAAHAALADLGAPSDLAGVIRRSLEETRYGWDSTVKQWVFALRLAGCRADVPLEVVTPFLREDDLRLHRAACRALKARGAPVPETRYMDPCALHHSTAAELAEALVHDDAVPRGAIASAIAARGDATAASELLAALEALPPPRQSEDLRAATRTAILRVLARSDDRRARVAVAAAIDEGEMFAELPSAFAPNIAKLFLRAKNKRVRDDAKDWIAAHAAEPDVETTLTSLGLAKEDFSRRAR